MFTNMKANLVKGAEWVIDHNNNQSAEGIIMLATVTLVANVVRKVAEPIIVQKINSSYAAAKAKSQNLKTKDADI